MEQEDSCHHDEYHYHSLSLSSFISLVSRKIEGKMMPMETFKINARGDFENLLGEVITALIEAGFKIVGKYSPLKNDGEHDLLYQVIIVDFPPISQQMLEFNAFEGNILPTCISVMETYPGQSTIAIANPAECYANTGSQTFRLSVEVNAILRDVLRKFASESNVIPDMVTSWE
ncbi:MAG TPA: hypothetical protein VGD40_26360 [Chryseosolibacter sp.]